MRRGCVSFLLRSPVSIIQKTATHQRAGGVMVSVTDAILVSGQKMLMIQVSVVSGC